MVKLTPCSNGTIKISGKTFNHKERLKLMGAKWQPKDKTWVISNTSENMQMLKSLKTSRRCGHCGEVGHFKPACEKYHEERKKEIRMKANALWNNRPKNYERLKHTGFCYCMFESQDFGYKDFSVLMPITCGACSSWCCSRARPMEEGNTFNAFRFNCPVHGDCFHQLMNDTTGT